MESIAQLVLMANKLHKIFQKSKVNKIQIPKEHKVDTIAKAML